MAISKKALANLSVEDLQALIAEKKKTDKVGPLLKKRDKLAKQLEKLEKKIAKMQGRSRPGRKPGRKPGRPARAAKKGKRKLSPEARAKIVAAQKRRWAKVKAQKAKAAEKSAPKE
jgi:hypothetical protein